MPGDRVPHADVRERRDGERPDLVARPAQGARDGARRAASGWSSTTTPPPTSRCGSSTAAWSSRRRRTSASTSSPTAAATSSIPRVEAAEPLEPRAAGLRARRSAPAPRRARTPQLGLEIVDVIEAAEESLRRNGEPVLRSAGAAERSRRLNEDGRPRAPVISPGRGGIAPFHPLYGRGDREGTDSWPRRRPHDRPWPSVRSGPKHLVPVANRPDPLPPPRVAARAPDCSRRRSCVEPESAQRDRAAVGDGSDWGLRSATSTGRPAPASAAR